MAHWQVTLVSALLVAGAATAAADEAAAPGLALQEIAHGLQSPIWLTSPPGDHRLFVVEQPGRIRVIVDGRLLQRPFLDLTSLVRDGGERGLLSVAFHPRYARNGRFYVDYTDREGNTRVERYTVSGDPLVADPTSAKLILRVRQPFANHKGGLVLFGPDGMLYVGLGDGGSEGDPLQNGQNRATLLGKLLRLDVDHGDPYAVPPDNPFARGRRGRPEIWAYGLRNPWRFCFDERERLLYIADVGQNKWEEVDVAPDSRPGQNYGWSLMEGRHCFHPPDCDPSGLVLPALEYGHDRGCAIIGGFVYRGRAIPELVGQYLYGDYCGGWIRSFRWDGHQATGERAWKLPRVPALTSFGQDADGEVYVLSQEGRVYRLVRAS